MQFTLNVLEYNRHTWSFMSLLLRSKQRMYYNNKSQHETIKCKPLNFGNKQDKHHSMYKRVNMYRVRFKYPYFMDSPFF